MIFWNVFVRGKCTPGWEEEAVKMFFDRLREKRVDVLAANRMGYLERV